MSPAKVLAPLSPFEAVLLPLLRLTRRGAEREKLNRRAELTAKRAQRLKEHQDLQKVLKKECKLYEKLIVDCYIRIGEAHMLSAAGIETGGRTPRKQKVQKVKFSRIFYNEEQVFFEIQVNRRWLHSTKNMLPHMVLVADLVGERAIFELSHATRRLVKASYTDPRFGAWIIVNRLMGFDGIPLHVTYKEMLEHYPAERIADAPLLLGAGENRKLVIFDFANYPHMLTGGATRSGKSNFINTVICNFLRFSRSEDLKLILIDLKRMEFGYYRDAPHLMRPIVMEPEEAIEVLSGLVTEIHRRAELLSNKAKELADWNRKFPDQAMPRIVLIIDEFAELMLASGTEVAAATKKLMARITNLGRAVGVHTVIATQRPATSVVDNSIKVNMPLIVAGRVQNSNQSVVILGTGDAARLPVLPGRMMYSDGANVHEVQTPHIQDEDVKEAVAIAKGRWAGVIDLDGFEPVIVPGGLVAYIHDHLEGKLTAANMKRLGPLGVPMRALKEFVAEVVSKGGWKVDGRIFRCLKREGNYWQLVEEMPFTYDETQPAPSVRPEWPALEYLPPLLLPAPKEAQAAAEEAMPEPPAEPEVAKPFVHPLIMSDDQIVDLFIERCCIKKRSYSEATAVLHRAYINFCHELDPEIPPINIRAFGQGMSKRGFKSIKLENRTKMGWQGLKLAVLDIQDTSAKDVDAA